MKDRNYSNMTEALKGLAENGYKENFMVLGKNLKAVEHDELFTRAEIQIVDFYRFEGESDPDDMAVLYVIETNSGLKGTVVDAFGTYATKEVGEFFNKAEDRREENEIENVLPSDSVR
jgi:hypothetical protein